MSKKTGGPAFPLQSIGPDFAPGYSGMTLRDWFAGKAMQGLIASPRGTPNGEDATTGYYAMAAYAMADSMIAEREKNND